MKWMTNILKSDVLNTMTNLANSRPNRRFMVDRPKAISSETTEDLERMGIVGVYEVVPETETKAS
jgi:hypothetical protein